jgi:hypothetical protein
MSLVSSLRPLSPVFDVRELPSAQSDEGLFIESEFERAMGQWRDSVVKIDETVKARVSLSLTLKLMWMVLWSAIRHPLSTTLIDPNTGRVLRRIPD